MDFYLYLQKAKSVASLKIKLQMAEFLQDTIEEIAVTSESTKPSKKLIEFSDFVTKVYIFFVV